LSLAFRILQSRKSGTKTAAASHSRTTAFPVTDEQSNVGRAKHKIDRRILVGQLRRRRRVSTIRLRQRRTRVDRFRATIRWRRNQRLTTLRRFVKRTAGQRWSPTLFQLLVDELVVDDDFCELIGSIDDVPIRRYPQAVAVALALRYSYRADLLRNFMRRLRQPPRRPRPARRSDVALRL
jgi:hypothetical protein